EGFVCEVHEQLPQVQINIAGNFSEIAGDEGLLRQALLNLARNAAEAAASHSPAPAVALRGETSSLSGDSSHRIRILDNGPGIPAEVLPKLFRPFFTTKADGTGLGLAVVQKILLHHGGEIEVRNRADGGAEFILTLPVSRGVSEAVESSEVTI